MRLRGVLAIVMSIAGAIVMTPVQALTVDLVYTSNTVNGDSVGGGGFFSAPNQPSIGLQDLTAFFFIWAINDGFGDPLGSFTVGLSDLLSFSATVSDMPVSGPTVTSLALSTDHVASDRPDLFNPEFFVITSLALGGAWNGPNLDGAGADVGSVAVAVRREDPAPIPEPASLVLFVGGLLGMGLVGLLRRAAGGASLRCLASL